MCFNLTLSNEFDELLAAVFAWRQQQQHRIRLHPLNSTSIDRLSPCIRIDGVYRCVGRCGRCRSHRSIRLYFLSKTNRWKSKSINLYADVWRHKCDDYFLFSRRHANLNKKIIFCSRSHRLSHSLAVFGCFAHVNFAHIVLLSSRPTASCAASIYLFIKFKSILYYSSLRNQFRDWIARSYTPHCLRIP